MRQQSARRPLHSGESGALVATFVDGVGLCREETLSSTLLDVLYVGKDVLRQRRHLRAVSDAYSFTTKIIIICMYVCVYFISIGNSRRSMIP